MTDRMNRWVDTTWVSYFSHCCDKIPDLNSLKKERFILGHGLRGFSQLLIGFLSLGVAHQGSESVWKRQLFISGQTGSSYQVKILTPRACALCPTFSN
jgi:hypothetical protein